MAVILSCSNKNPESPISEYTQSFKTDKSEDYKKISNSEYIKAGCNRVNQIQDKIPDDFAYIDFFHNYLKLRSYNPQSINYFTCAQKLDNQAFYLLALDREPLNGFDNKSKVDEYSFHREIIRNLYKIVVVTKSPEQKLISISGVSAQPNQQKFFDIKDESLFKAVSNPNLYIKFYSNFNERENNYSEFYVPVKNYNLIKKYLVQLNQSKTQGGGGNFAVSFSAFIYLISPEISKNKEFKWIEEISATPYYSALQPLSNFVAKDQVIYQNNLIFMGHNYSSRLFESEVLLARIMKEVGIIKENFSIIPEIEKSLKSGNKEYCGRYRNLEDLLVVEKLHSKKLEISKTFLKYCIINQKSDSLNNESEKNHKAIAL